PERPRPEAVRRRGPGGGHRHLLGQDGHPHEGGDERARDVRGRAGVRGRRGGLRPEGRGPHRREPGLTGRPPGPREGADVRGAPQRSVYVKGAAERVLAGCDRVLGGGEVTELNEYTRKQIGFRNQEMATRALRVLALAYRELPPDAPVQQEEVLESGLVFLGL